MQRVHFSRSSAWRHTEAAAVQPAPRWLRRAVLAVGLIGLLVFGSGWAISWLQPLWVEQAAREVVRLEVERRVGARLEDLSETRIGALARKALEKTTADADQAERELREQVPQRVAQVVADLLRADCDCRRRLQERAQAWQRGHLESLREVQARLTRLIEQAYASTRDQLLREFRIFTVSNALLFGLLALLALVRRQSARELALVAVLLLSAAGGAAAAYLLAQDWLHTVVFNDYWGWGYAAYQAGIAVLLVDLALWRGALTSGLLNAVSAVFPALC